jgi:WD40 repeat protein
LASRAWQSLQPGLAAEHLKRCVREDGDRDLRGFEWHYIDALLNSTPSPMARHDGEAYYIDFSADGRWMATCGSDGMRVFETDRWREVSHLQGHRSDVNSASFSPSGRWLVSAGDDATALVWDVERWQPHATIPCDAPVVFAFFNRDETAVLTAQRETTVAAVEPNLVSKFEFPSNTLQWQTKIPGGSLHGAAYAPEQDQLVVTTDAGVIAAVDCETGAVHRERLPTPAPSVTVLAGTPYVAAGDKAGTVQLRSLLGSEAPNLQFSCVDRGLESLAYSPNERRLVHASRDGTAGLWRVDVGNATRPLRAERIYRHQSPLWCARLDRDGENLVTVDRSGAVTRWGLREPNVQVPRRLHCGDLHAMSRSELACAASGSRRFDVSADCKLAAGASYGDPLRVWDLQSGRQLLEIDGERLRHVFPELAEHGGEPEIVRFVPGNASGSDVLCVSIRGQSVFIDPRSGEPVDYLATGGTINAAYPVWHPSGTVFAVVVVPDMRLEVWNAAENRLVASFDSDVSDVAWSPDGKRLMTGHYAGYAAIYAVDGLKSGAAPWSERVRFVADQEVAYSADGKTIASASTKSVTLWNAATLRKLIELPIPGEFGFEWVTVRFASDGRSLTVEGLTPDSLEQCIWVLGEH